MWQVSGQRRCPACGRELTSSCHAMDSSGAFEFEFGGMSMSTIFAIKGGHIQRFHRGESLGFSLSSCMGRLAMICVANGQSRFCHKQWLEARDAEWNPNALTASDYAELRDRNLSEDAQKLHTVGDRLRMALLVHKYDCQLLYNRS